MYNDWVHGMSNIDRRKVHASIGSELDMLCNLAVTHQLPTPEPRRRRKVIQVGKGPNHFTTCNFYMQRGHCKHDDCKHLHADARRGPL